MVYVHTHKHMWFLNHPMLNVGEQSSTNKEETKRDFFKGDSANPKERKNLSRTTLFLAYKNLPL